MKIGCNWRHAYRASNNSWEEYSSYIDKCIPTIMTVVLTESQDPLFALVQLLNKLIFAAGTNVTLMEQTRDRIYDCNITSNTLSESLEIVPVPPNKPHDLLAKRGLASYGEVFLKMAAIRVSWSDVGNCLASFVAGGSFLKFIQLHTKRVIVDKVYNAYVGIGGLIGYLLGVLCYWLVFLIGVSAALIRQRILHICGCRDKRKQC